MRIAWSEVQEVIDILTILKNNGIDLQYIIENTDIKLKDIEGIESLIRENKWEKELSIGRATLKILESAKYIRANKSIGSSGYRVTEEQITQLISLGLLTEKGLQHENEEPYRRANTAVKQNFAIDELINVLKILKKHNFGIENIPKTSFKLGEIAGLEQIIEEEKLDPTYNIGRVLERLVRQIRRTNNGEDVEIIYKIPKNRIKILEELGVISQNDRAEEVAEKVLEEEQEISSEDDPEKAPEGEQEILPEEEVEKVPEEEQEILIEEDPEKAPEGEQEILSEEEVEKEPEREAETLLEVNPNEELKKRRQKQQGKRTAADKLIELLDILETYIPGISRRLPKAGTKLGDIKEISEIIELLGLPKDRKINIGVIVSKAKAQAIGLYVDRLISVSNIEALKRYGLLTDEEIEKYKKREEGKVNGKVKTNSQVLIEVLQILIKHGVDILDLPRSSIKIGEIDYLSHIVQQEKIDKNYDIGINLGNTILAIKEILSGKSSRYAVSDDEIKQMRAWGFVSDWDLEKYQKQISSTQELIIICRKLQHRGINLQSLLPYEVEIGKIEDIEGLEQIIREEQIPERYKIGKVMSSVLHTAKTKILERENPEYKKIRNSELLRINDDEIEELINLGILTEEAMETFRKGQTKKLNDLLTERTLAQYKSENSGEALDRIMRAAVAQYVADNEETRRELAEILLNKEDINKE